MRTGNVSQTRPVLYNLEALRGFCALMVALVHVPWTTHLLFLPIVYNAWMFVDFFFVLSGFIIAFNYADSGQKPFHLQGFMVRRFFRLYPLHIVTLIMLLAVEIFRELVVPLLTQLPPRGAFQDPFGVTLVLNVLLLHATGLTTQNILNTPSWSISTEFWTYLLFAFICKLWIKPGKRVAAMAALGGCALMALLWLNGAGGIATPIQYGWPRCIMSFSMGVVVWFFHARWRPRPDDRWLDASYLVLFPSIYILMGFAGRTSLLNLAVVPLFGLIIYMFAIDGGSRVKKVMQTAPMQALGRLSYSIYMVHVFWTSIFGFALNRFFAGKTTIFEMGNRLDVSLVLGDLVTIIYLLCVIGTAALTYQIIEQPWRRYGGRLAKRLNGEPTMTSPAVV
ncbi:hypothetical protein GGD83_004114 [Rhodoblastus sphagnicola]|nr:acyltransferase [Rhodoblastus sphagnicola]MBB4200285.1 hypothetical protein [Rhodoblastus sphagnicola]